MLSLLLACAAPPITRPDEPPTYPVDPGFTGDVTLDGATVAYYPVEGRNDIEVFASLRARGPAIGGGPHGAATTWKIDWKSAANAACAPVDVTAGVTVTFPRWTPPPDAPRASLGNWQRYVRALTVHEQGHVDRIREIAGQLPALLAAAGCDGQVAKWEETRAAIAEINDAYDRETDNGAAQGAALFVPRGG
jgi:predicted secreted Zn-dependent protease